MNSLVLIHGPVHTVFNFSLGNLGTNLGIPNLDDLLGSLLPPPPPPDNTQPNPDPQPDGNTELKPTEPGGGGTTTPSTDQPQPDKPQPQPDKPQDPAAGPSPAEASSSSSTTTSISTATSGRGTSSVVVASSINRGGASASGRAVVAIAPGIELWSLDGRGRSTLRFTLTRSGDTRRQSSVAWAVKGRGRNPAAARDFGGRRLPSGTVDFAAGETSRTVRLQVRPADQDKGFALRLEDATGAALGRSRLQVIIAERDSLTGTGGEDTYGFRYGDSLIGRPSRITDFRFGEERIAVLNRKGQALDAPNRFSRAADNSTARSLRELAAAVFADADGRRAGDQALGRRSAALVVATNAGIRGTYLLINNDRSGLNPRDDLMVKITGFSGGLPGPGRIDPAQLFA